MSTGKIEIFDQSGTDPIVIAPSSPRWAADAHKWMRAVSNVVSDSDHRVEHIGSTSVPGLAAKPVIDILVPVTHLAHEESYLPGIEGLGLILRAREADNRFFRPPAGRPRTVHVHVCEIGSSWESAHLRFRDALIASPGFAEEYALLKERLANEFTADREAYTRGKSDFIKSVLSSAGK
ncbi:MAG: GrpB family protein [Brevibacterium sp.]